MRSACVLLVSFAVALVACGDPVPPPRLTPPRKPAPAARAIVDEASFFRLIEASRAGTTTADHLRALDGALQKLSDDDLVAFDGYLYALMAATERGELWAAAVTLLGAASDDTFDAFRAWLLLQGQKTLERAVADPDSLADLPLRERPTTDELLSLAAHVYRARNGFPLPHDPAPTVGAGWPLERFPRSAWTDALRKSRLPRLVARESAGLAYRR